MKKKEKLIFMVCILFSGFAKGQSQYISPLFSYSFGLNSMTYSTYDDYTEISQDTSTTSTSYTYHSTKFSLGGGKSFGAMYGRTISNNFSFEFGINYFKGNEKEVKYSSEIQYVPLKVYNVKLNNSRVFSYNSFNFLPSIIFSANKNTWNPYFRLGLYLSYGKLKENQTLQIYNNFPGYFPLETYEYTYIYSPKFIVGWQEGAGIAFSKEKFLNFYFEVQYLTLNYNPDKKVCTKALYQGEDNMSNIKPSEKNVYFVDTYTTNTQAESDNPGKQLKQKFSMNNLSLQCGIRFIIK